MPRLVPCPSCACHVKRSEPHCPHCGARLSKRAGQRTKAALALGLTTVVPVAAVSCSDDEDRDYSTVSASTKYGYASWGSIGAGGSGNDGGGGAGGDEGGAAGNDGGRGGSGGAGGS
jgi:hypothetical protein